MYKLSIFYNVYEPAKTELLMCLLGELGIEIENIVEQKAGDNSGLFVFVKTKEQANNYKESLAQSSINDVTVEEVD